MSGARRNYYEVLGLPPTASAGEIQRAFRSLARELHPDVNPGPDAAARFDEVSTAYAVLHDPQERARYDRSTLRVRSGGPPGARRAPSFSDRAPSFSDRAPSFSDRAPSFSDRAPSFSDRAPSFTPRRPARDVPRFVDARPTVRVSLVIRLRNPFRWLR